MAATMNTTGSPRATLVASLSRSACDRSAIEALQLRVELRVVLVGLAADWSSGARVAIAAALPLAHDREDHAEAAGRDDAGHQVDGAQPPFVGGDAERAAAVLLHVVGHDGLRRFAVLQA